jgi:hypothetical protein
MASGDWRQDAEMPAPLWTATAAELAARISIENLDGTYALHLFTHHDAARIAQLQTLASWAGALDYHVGAEEAARPIEQGFLRRLRFWRSRQPPAQPLDALGVIAEFTAAERARVARVEPWLREVYGPAAPPGRVFDWIDYPVFDCGTMVLGFAVLVHGPELHMWSRAAHAHK